MKTLAIITAALTLTGCAMQSDYDYALEKCASYANPGECMEYTMRERERNRRAWGAAFHEASKHEWTGQY